MLILLTFMIPEFLETKMIHAVNGFSEGTAITSRYILNEKSNFYEMAYCEVLGIITNFKLFLFNRIFGVSEDREVPGCF